MMANISAFMAKLTAEDQLGNEAAIQPRETLVDLAKQARAAMHFCAAAQIELEVTESRGGDCTALQQTQETALRVYLDRMMAWSKARFVGKQDRLRFIEASREFSPMFVSEAQWERVLVRQQKWLARVREAL